jgi:hypothetical protein
MGLPHVRHVYNKRTKGYITLLTGTCAKSHKVCRIAPKGTSSKFSRIVGRRVTTPEKRMIGGRKTGGNPLVLGAAAGAGFEASHHLYHHFVPKKSMRKQTGGVGLLGAAAAAGAGFFVGKKATHLGLKKLGVVKPKVGGAKKRTVNSSLALRRLRSALKKRAAMRR